MGQKISQFWKGFSTAKEAWKEICSNREKNHFEQVLPTNDNIYKEYQAPKEEIEKCRIEFNNLRIDNEILKASTRLRLAEEAKRNTKH